MDLPAIHRLGVKPSDLSRTISLAFAEMIFLFGDVHCDPHAANLLVRKKVGVIQIGMREQVEEHQAELFSCSKVFALICREAVCVQLLSNLSTHSFPCRTAGHNSCCWTTVSETGISIFDFAALSCSLLFNLTSSFVAYSRTHNTHCTCSFVLQACTGA